MSTVSFYMGDIVRVIETGHESRVHGVGHGFVLLRFGSDFKRISTTEVEMVMPEMAVQALQDKKFLAWDRERQKATRAAWLRVLATPPDGWRLYGPHAPEDITGPVEFWGEDPDTGEPIWERPLPPEKTCYSCDEAARDSGEGRYCPACQDYEGTCINDHCLTCGAVT